MPFLFTEFAKKIKHQKAKMNARNCETKTDTDPG